MIGVVVERITTPEGARLEVSSGVVQELKPGDSVAINGTCLTAVSVTDERFIADVMLETLRRTSLDNLVKGDQVNLELPISTSARLGGHFVQGHVDGVGTVVDIRADGFAKVVTIEPPSELLRYIVEKGSITVEGVSLTVAQTVHSAFTVSLIPETLTRTTLGRLGVGQFVNLEVDILAKYVEQLMKYVS